MRVGKLVLFCTSTLELNSHMILKDLTAQTCPVVMRLSSMVIMIQMHPIRTVHLRGVIEKHTRRPFQHQTIMSLLQHHPRDVLISGLFKRLLPMPIMPDTFPTAPLRLLLRCGIRLIVGQLLYDIRIVISDILGNATC